MYVETTTPESPDLVKEQLRLDYRVGESKPIFRDPAFMENPQVPFGSVS